MSGLGVSVLPCGCVLNGVVENGMNVLKWSPCKLDCEYYLYGIARMSESHKPVEFKEGP